MPCRAPGTYSMDCPWVHWQWFKHRQSCWPVELWRNDAWDLQQRWSSLQLQHIVRGRLVLQLRLLLLFQQPKVSHHILFFWIVILTLESPHPNQKERFYQQKGHLAEPSSPELARFINMCLTYEPEERLSFRKVLRELIELMRKGQCLLDYFISFFKTLLQFIQ